MTVKEIAKKENVHIQTVRQWIKLGKLKARPTSTGYFISVANYLSFVSVREGKEADG